MTGDRAPRWRRYLGFVRPNVPADVEDELAFHLQSRIERNIALGLAPDDARREAIERFGDVDTVRSSLVRHDEREQATERRAEYVADLVQDLHFGWRALRRTPGFAIAAVLTLALGIGANTAIFSVLNAVVLQPLPYAHPERLVTLGQGSSGEYLALEERLRTVTDLAEWDPTTDPVDDGRDALRLTGVAVTPNLMPMLGAAPMLGRGFAPNDGLVGNNHVLLLSYVTWRGEFGGARDVVGRTLTLDGLPYTIVGVMPPSFRYPNTTVQYWRPYVIDPRNTGLMWGVGGKQFVGRLAPHATLDGARRELRAVWPSLRTANPIWDPGPDYRRDATVTPLKADVVGASAALLWMLFGATLLVLLIACVNVANLLLARATARERELAVRAALGGGRGRLMRQLVTEGLLLSVIGAAAGVGLAVLTVRALVGAVPTGLPRADEITVNSAALVFALMMSVATGVVFSIVPAIRATSAAAWASGSMLGRRTTASLSHARASAWLVGAEIALAVMLVVGSLLLVRSFAALRAIAPGFDPSHVIAARISVPEATYAPGSDRLAAFYADILERTRAMPGVRSAALVDQLSLAAPVWAQAIRVQGQSEDVKHTLPMVDHFQTVTPGYFAAMGIPMLRGRSFTDDDRAGQPPVAVVSQSVAKRFWPREDAIGQRIGYPFDSPWITIVGVVPDTKQDSLRDTSTATMYMPWAQRTRMVGSELWLVVRTTGDPVGAGFGIRRIVHDIDRGVPVSDVRTMDDVVSGSVVGARFAAALITVFALVALALGAVGIFGVMSSVVNERRQEMGLRMALGATQGRVVKLVVGRALRLAAVGTLAGLVCAIVAVRPLHRWLYGVSAMDPVTFAAVPIVFAVVALLASYLPARRATRVEPVAAMHDAG
ncbi:MAG TPA: ABC transporter permease [Gemmatimonadaceae bacterium]|nr:ABC transporter permease [Gemmatimonadaceae bacterium]